MKNMHHFSRLSVFMLVLFALPVHGQDTLTVTANGTSAYIIDGESNPSLTLLRGNTYVFDISTPGHPFWIKTQAGVGTGNAYSTGITGGGTSSGFLTFSVPESAPDQLFYNCQFHSPMTGMINITSTVNISQETGAPDNFRLAQNFPNPFNPTTTIEFSNPENGYLNLAIYSLTGRKIRTLVDAVIAAGSHTIEWDGMTEDGRPAGTGVYLYRMSTPHGSLTRRMIILK